MICKHGDKCDCYNENMYPCNHDDMVKCVYYKNGGYNDMVVGTDDEKYRSIIDHYGEPAQVLKAIEEMAELQEYLLEVLYSTDHRVARGLSNITTDVTVTKVACKNMNVGSLCIGSMDKDCIQNTKLECADVENMLSQLRIIFGSWEDKRVEKLDRTMERIGK